MNLSLFITRRLAFSTQQSFSRLIIRVAIVAVALSVAVMILAGAIVTGFQKQISEKVFGFWGHIVIQNIAQGRSYEEEAIPMAQKFYPALDTVPGIRHIQVFATKAGIIKTPTALEGLVLKGIGSDFDWSFMSRYIVNGNYFDAGDTSTLQSIIISQSIATRLTLKVGDRIKIYFLPDMNRARPFTVTGIYKTGLEEYDKQVALVNINIIRRLNGWKPDEAGGFEVYLNDVRDLDKMGEKINNNYLDQNLAARTLKEINPNLFDWLGLQSINEVVIMVLMILVAIINMTTMLLIIILERTNMIGVLKAIGSNNGVIRNIFLYQAFIIMTVGLLIGNLFGLGLGLLQQHFHIITLPEETYYVSEIPILFNPLYILAVDAGTLLVCIVTLAIPAYLVWKITPVKAIRFK